MTEQHPQNRSNYLFNTSVGTTTVPCLKFEDDILSFHQSLPNYAPTPLLSLPNMAKNLGIKQLWLKDESKRFGLNAFKGVGASYAIHKYLQKHNTSEESVTFCAATAGNHGRSVAWAARMNGQKSVIFVPKRTAPDRIKNIEAEGAKVIVVDGTYDETVQFADLEAKKNGWVTILDTAFEEYTEIPELIMKGYSTILREMESEINTPGRPQVDFVFLQAGVGSWLHAAVAYYVNRYPDFGNRPKFICVEPKEADCYLESMKQGKLTQSLGTMSTCMAGLNCSTPSMISFPFVSENVDYFMSIPDSMSHKAIRTLYHNHEDTSVIAGESGSAGFAALLALMTEPEWIEVKNRMGINENSRVLVFNTEGDTDKVGFSNIINSC